MLTRDGKNVAINMNIDFTTSQVQKQSRKEHFERSPKRKEGSPEDYYFLPLFRFSQCRVISAQIKREMSTNKYERSL